MRVISRLFVLCMLYAFTFGLCAPGQALSITVKEEKELSKEFLKVIHAQCDLNEELYLNDYVNKIGRTILSVMPKQPFEYHFYVINDDQYNAFATPAGHIFIYSGLIEAMDNEDQLAGIMAHEIAHVTCRHISQNIARAKKIQLATLAGMIAGAFLAGENPEIGQAVYTGAQAAGYSVALSYSRENERQSDKVGLEYLKKAGYNGEELMTILQKMKSKNWFDTGSIPSYLMTHPGTNDRISYIDSWLSARGNKKKQKSKKKLEEFSLVQTRLIATNSDASLAQKKFESMLKTDKKNTMAYYGYGLVLERIGKKKEAIVYLKKALEQKAFSTEILTALGRVYLFEGSYNLSLKTLESALSILPDSQESLFYLGRAYAEVANYVKAISIFSKLLKINPDYKQTYYHLGKTYGKIGKLADAHYNLGKYYLRERKYKTAKVQFEKALENTTNTDRKQEIRKILKTLLQLQKNEKKEKP